MQKQTIVFLDAGSIGDDILWPDFSSFGEVKTFQHSSMEEAMNRIEDATIVLTNKVSVTHDMIEHAKKLKYIGTLSTGYNQVDTASALQKNIIVCNVPDYSTQSVAQHTMALILSLAGEICLHSRAVAQGEWITSTHFSFWKKPIFELSGKVLGLIGFGNIGQAVGKLAHAFGMQVIAYTPRPKEKPSYSPFSFDSLDNIFSKSDVVSLHCPLTTENTGLVNKERLIQMKKTALLINSSRGPLIESKDLVWALNSNEIAGAGLDVISTEPMVADEPLMKAKNCIITPHNAWATVEARTRLMQIAFNNITSFLQGSPVNICNK